MLTLENKVFTPAQRELGEEVASVATRNVRTLNPYP